MKLCLVSQEYPPETGGGGIGTQTHLKAVGLAARGHEVHVLAASTSDRPTISDDGGATIHRIGEPRVSGPGYEQSTYWLAYSSAVAEQLHSLDRDIGFDLVQFPEYGGEGFVYQTDTFAHRTAKYVVQLHGPLAMFSDKLGWPEPGTTLHSIGCFMERSVIHHADLILSSSSNTAEFVAGTYDYPLDAIQVIHSGVDTGRFTPTVMPRDGAGPRVLFVGNIVGAKGVFVVGRAVERLRDRYPLIRLRVLGKGSIEERRRLERAFAGREEALELIGYTPYAELPRHYSWADMLVAPSTFEPGPGNVYLEAMACARPVVAAVSGGAPEVVLDRKTGLLVPPGDVDAIEAAIVELADDADLRASLGTAGRAWIESRFSLDRYVDKVETIYQEVLAR
jgi:glycosyltransferase involved in cell wall biosynthesis